MDADPAAKLSTELRVGGSSVEISRVKGDRQHTFDDRSRRSLRGSVHNQRDHIGWLLQSRSRKPLKIPGIPIRRAGEILGIRAAREHWAAGST